MQYKKLFPLLFIFAFTSCEEPPQDETPGELDETTYKDGTYVATYDQFGFYDSKAFLKFKLVNDEIKDVDFDYINLSGQRLSQGADFPCITFDPFTLLPDIENAIANASVVPDFVEIDIIAQANKEIEDANKLTKAILNSALDGNTDTVFIEQAYLVKYINGSYRAESSEFDYGWKSFLEVEISEDELVSVNFDYFDEEGNLKSETTVENYPMDPHPTVWIPEYETRLYSSYINCYSEVDVVTGATHGWNSVNVLMTAVLSAANDGDTSTQVVVME